jgi:hypothetical protein
MKLIHKTLTNKVLHMITTGTVIPEKLLPLV